MPEPETKPKKSKLSTVSWLLVGLIVLINGYILLSPLVPQFELWKRRHQAQATAGLPYKTNLDKTPAQDIKRAGIPADNRLVIPRLALNEHIYVGANPHLVNQGVWARPNTSTPPNASNTVLVAHRFTYDGPSIFYSLDKVLVGDKLVMYWHGKEYDYTVKSSSVVPATDIAVENGTAQSQLTLYTCTPLWSAKDRLVVVASLDKKVIQ